jgi:hypothetical protein
MAMAGELSDGGSSVPKPISAGRRKWLVALVTATLAATGLGLAAWFSSPPSVHVNFATEPFEAMILIDGEPQKNAEGRPCLTPCTIDGLSAEPHHVVFQLDGRTDLDLGMINFRHCRHVHVRWPSD